MHKYTLILCSLFFTFSAFSQNLHEVESTFQKGDFATAKNLYTQLLDKSSGNDKLQIQLRLAACEYHLGEFLSAAKTMRSYPLPEDPLWQARFLLYRIYTAKQASSTYDRILNPNEIRSPQAAQDPAQWTQAQWQQAIDQDYRRLWQLREALSNAPIEQENLILNLKDTDTKRIPTLFDFTVNSWLTYLNDFPTQNVQPLSPQEPSFLDATARLKEGSRKSTTLLRSQILDNAAQLEGKNRQNARLFWLTDFTLLPFTGNDFVLKNPQQSLRIAQDTLLPFIKGKASHTNAWNRLKAFFTSAQAQPVYARGYTAWQLAQLLSDKEQYATALEITRLASDLQPSSFVNQCQNLAQDITRVTLSARNENQPVNRTQPTLSLTGKNLKQVYVRVYKTSFKELTQLSPNRNTVASWSYLTHLNNREIATFLSRAPLHAQQVSIPYVEVGKAQQATFHLPTLDAGFYVVLMSAEESFEPKKQGIFGWVLNATDLAVFATAAIAADPADYVATRNAPAKKYQPDVFHLYTFNLNTGLPEPNTPLRLRSAGKASESSAQTNGDGMLDLPRTITVSNRNGTNNSYSLDVLAQKADSTAYLSNALYFNFYNEAPVQLFIQTDRPIYRPGQKVHLSVQAFERLPRGLKTLGQANVQIKITDPNGKQIFASSPRLGKLGNAQVTFTLPENTLLGYYSVSSSLVLNNRTYRASHFFSLEEYKRPDYELTLAEPSSPLVYNKKALLSGSAKYYFGAPVQQAQVTYTIKYRSYVPPFYWWWFRMLPTEEKIILQGQSVTDDKGMFNIPFTPTRQEEDEEFAHYELEVQLYDESGRPVKANRSYKISAHPHLFNVEFTQGFYDANQPAALAKINLTDADGNAVAGNIALTISLLENRQPDIKTKNNPANKLDALYQDFTAQKTVLKRSLSFKKPGEQLLQMPALPEGVYRLELTSPKASKQQMVFVVAAQKSNLLLPDVALVQHATYYPGETMRVLLGAGNLQGTKQVEIYQRNRFLTHRARLNGGVEIFTLPLTNKHRGGVALRWFGASNYQLHAAQTSAEIPFDNKKLVVQTALPSAAKPGQTVNWKVTARDNAGRPANGLINATVYDKSLDYYVANHPFLKFNNLYTQQTSAAQQASSAQGSTPLAYYPKSQNLFQSDTDPLPLPSINLQMMFRSYARFGRGASGLMMMSKAVASDEAVMESSMAPRLQTNGATHNALDTATEAAEEDSPAVRTDFSETAYFNPALPLVNGQAALHFTLPQSLTTWNIFGFALTEQADFGDFKASFITRKDVMVRLQLPRFYREEDQGIIQAAVTNQTNKKITTQVSLAVSRNNTRALDAFGITQPVQTVTVAPNTTQFVSWKVTAPAEPALYTVTAVARHGQESDGEQKTLPVLPSKMRLLAAAHRALHNGNNTLSLDELTNVPAHDVQRVALTLNPSLALSVLNSMPNLLSYPYKDLVSSLNRYVPLAVVHQFYTTYPQLKKAVQKLPKRSGLTPAWDEQDPLRLQLLEQTPWLRQAQGRQARQENIISLFDDKIVSNYLEKELKSIKRFQNTDGSFSWFAGGPADDYLTLYALQSFAQALSYQADIPQSAAQQALGYIIPRIEKTLKQNKSGSVAALSYALYAAYTLSSFPQTWEQTQRAKPYIKRWVDYADSQFKFMTPLGQIYAAAVYHRLGDDVKANKYLDLVLSRLKEDTLTGAYFAPEPQSWVWYNDTLTTQTVTLRTLLEMRPQSPKIRPMVQWLLFNRQVNDWTDSKAASQAVFTLLDVMQKEGAFNTSSSYQLNWAGQTHKRTFEPFDWTEDLQFIKEAPHITPAAYTAQIHKQGTDTPDFASLNAIYQAAQVQASPKGVINLERTYFLREKQGTTITLRPLASGDILHAGDEVEVHLTLTTDSAFEYVLLHDPKPAGFESPNLLSGWEYQNISFYREEKDAATNFFISWVPRGTVTLRYTLQPTVTGRLNALAAQVQSMYAPEYGAHSASASFTVER